MLTLENRATLIEARVKSNYRRQFLRLPQDQSWFLHSCASNRDRPTFSAFSRRVLHHRCADCNFKLARFLLAKEGAIRIRAKSYATSRASQADATTQDGNLAISLRLKSISVVHEMADLGGRTCRQVLDGSNILRDN